jgi:hypothetical protein
VLVVVLVLEKPTMFDDQPDGTKTIARQSGSFSGALRQSIEDEDEDENEDDVLVPKVS